MQIDRRGEIQPARGSFSRCHCEERRNGATRQSVFPSSRSPHPNAVIARTGGAPDPKRVYRLVRTQTPGTILEAPYERRAPKRCHCEERSDAAIRFPAFEVAAPKRCHCEERRRGRTNNSAVCSERTYRLHARSAERRGNPFFPLRKTGGQMRKRGADCHDRSADRSRNDRGERFSGKAEMKLLLTQIPCKRGFWRRSPRNSANKVIEIRPSGIKIGYQGVFSLTAPAFYLFFTLDSVTDIVKYLKVNQLMNIVFCGEGVRKEVVFMLIHSFFEIVSHTCVNRHVSEARQNVYIVIFIHGTSELSDELFLFVNNSADRRGEWGRACRRGQSPA